MAGYLFGVKTCHCGACEICQHCSHACLSVAFADWGGEAAGCDCQSLDGTYILSRGIGRKPSAFISVTATTGSGAVLRGVLAWDDATGTYLLDDVIVVAAGSGYSNDATGAVNIIDGKIGCGDSPTVDIILAARTHPATLEFDAWDAATPVTFTITWAPANATVGSETWSVDSFTIIDGGSGQQDLSGTNPATPQPASIVEVQPFGGMTWEVDRAEPVLAAFSVTTAGGAGATFTPNWAVDAATQAFIQGLGYADGRYWQIGLPSITGGGTGYALGDVVEYTLSGEHQTYGEWPNAPASRYAATVTGIGGSGEITELTISAAQDLHIRSDGTVVSIIIYDATDRGEYYVASGIEDATVTNPGKIFPTSGEGGDACTYSLCENINCGDGPVCRKISLSIGAEEHTLTVSIGGEVVATGTIPAEGNSCGDMTFESSDFTSDCSSPGSVTVEAGECDGGPSDIACCTVPCSDCEDVCVMYAQGRTGTGFLPDEGGFTYDWFVSQSLGGYVFWSENNGGPTRRSDAVSFSSVQCVDGEWVLGATWRSQVASAEEGLTGKETIRDWDVRLLFDGSGCPVAVEFLSFTESYGVNGPSIYTPVKPEVVWECNPLP